MIRKFPSTSILLLLALAAWALFAPAANASDTAKERRWAEQVIDGLLDGEAVWLNDGASQKFLGILTEGDAESGRAVILMHGLGVHPNWPDVIYPLRVGLLDHGITSLSIQMPILANGVDAREYLKLLPEVAGRIDATLDYLDDAGYRDVVLVGHSMGSSMAIHYMSQNPSSAVTSFVAIGMGAGVGGTDVGDENIVALEKVGVPVFDLFGSEDNEEVLDSADARAAAAKGGVTPEYRQVRVDGANHFFQGHEAELVRNVLEWIDAQAGK